MVNHLERHLSSLEQVNRSISVEAKPILKRCLELKKTISSPALFLSLHKNLVPPPLLKDIKHLNHLNNLLVMKIQVVPLPVPKDIKHHNHLLNLLVIKIQSYREELLLKAYREEDSRVIMVYMASNHMLANGMSLRRDKPPLLPSLNRDMGNSRLRSRDNILPFPSNLMVNNIRIKTRSSILKIST